ncbi:Pyruvate/Phosphoenolpyruvate kinase-like domain-containing protein [Xylariaceae sp. FL1651]|nr:Pyruvate/Phosphoenolpyruvate kinase-like domain-containing protein [Xylariaceae sp. FL1651]
MASQDRELGSLKISQLSTATARLRAALADETNIVVCPGVYDGFTARIVLSTGFFDALYMTGAGTTASRLGMPDLGVATLNDMAENASMIAGLDRSVPLIADADTGYGGPLMVRRTVESYIRGGVAALHIEDQAISKRCGHLANKELVDEEVFISRIRAAVLTREQLGSDIVIIARTDALAQLGYDVAVSRLRRAIQAGADVAFLEALQTKEQMQQACHDLAPTPVLLNMVESGKTPILTPEEARQIGFRIIIFPGFALGPVYEAVKVAAGQLKADGRVKPVEAMKNGPKGLFEVLGLKEAVEFDVSAGGQSFAGGV